jgi:hypothetical protein
MNIKRSIRRSPYFNHHHHKKNTQSLLSLDVQRSTAAEWRELPRGNDDVSRSPVDVVTYESRGFEV